MKKSITILIAGLVVCAAAFGGFYFWGTASHREMLREPTPELAWLQQEFNLSDAEFTRITTLHDAYQPHCREMCRRIDQQNVKLQTLMTNASAMTPEISAALDESVKLRGECQRNMLQHFFEVSRTMPPAQGRRYLEWISERTFMPSHGDMNTVAR